jgi:tetraacyldisaccharide 4'-kinase
MVAHPLASMRDTPVFGFCGIGNPENFRRTLSSLGCRLVGFKNFPDHYRFTRNDQLALESAAQSTHAKVLVCTTKDLVKWRAGDRPEIPVRALRIQAELTQGAAEFQQRLSATLEQDRQFS